MTDTKNSEKPEGQDEACSGGCCGKSSGASCSSKLSCTPCLYIWGTVAVIAVLMMIFR